MTFDLNYYFSYYLSEGRPITVRVYKNIYHPSSPRDIKKYPPDKLSDKKSDIAELSVYVFVKLAEREDNQIIALYLEHLEAIDDSGKDLFTDGVFTVDVVVIIADDYISFFKKIKRKPWTEK